MPTPTETLQGIRDEATVNAAALQSVDAQLAVRQAEVEAFNPSPGKGAALDQVRRLRGEYQRTRAAALSMVDVATRILTGAGADPGPGPGPDPVTWSTGDW